MTEDQGFLKALQHGTEADETEETEEGRYEKLRRE
jgi:hypothetical protein